jgi:uncharacterized integral membrane protein (TIGR00698 family)
MEKLLACRSLLPGLAVCCAVAVVALVLERAETVALGKPWLEALVIAIVLGAMARTAWTPPARFDPGIQCAAKAVLELAVVMMGATVGFGAMLAAGGPLLLAIVVTVAGAIGASFLLDRLFGLPTRMALLVACGNAICGNSAIAAIAPVIDADGDDVATSIAFTAVLGIVVVVAMPLVAVYLGLSAAGSGILAGLTVYAVPQVLAAAGPMGTAAVQLGTLVKLVRVLALGPVVAVLSLLMAALHSLGLLPEAWVAPAHRASGLLTVLAMAGLGLCVDVRSVFAAGLRMVCVVTLSLLLLGGLAFGMMRLTGLA